ncbi:hypothetical protein B0H67DRAFT_490925 [Lasiosphaeris hirsuta]|uniref:DUF4238 domain-containing protein n=1 Tax=Lasiosphaeris hirsuta TaxID=260670 RepID=A0AA40AI53_9PEZI|nr:hypothetical protein B0H67DRAFT_490925 [Lasiosphaeris hirsuta]
MAATLDSQYQHFVPQFLLKNFSHQYKRGGRRRGKRNDNEPFYGQVVVRNLDLSLTPPGICEKSISRILGQINMYKDTAAQSDQQQRLEAKLSSFESRASTIFQRFTRAFAQKQDGVWLSRDERDLIRKFLFLLKYRGGKFYRRFCHETPKQYDADDRETMWEYMANKGFERPLDVWLDNLEAIMELDMDPSTDWLEQLRKRMYPEDAEWFYSHTEHYYMAICTPSDPDDEFILTDNAYNVFEGPNLFVRGRDTGEVGGATYTPLHEFAPISPKLIIILRNRIFPLPGESEDELTWMNRELRRLCVLGPRHKDVLASSLLVDLPVRVAENNYTRDSYDSGHWEKKKEHNFFFRFFSIDSMHVNTVNAILLDNCYHCTSIVFESQANFARTLEWYLTAQCTVGKVILGTDTDVRWETLKKLEAVSHSLGSRKETVWERPECPEVPSYEAFRRNVYKRRQNLSRILSGEQHVLESPFFGGTSSPLPDPLRSYENLGGSWETVGTDLNQTLRMWALRVMIDTWSKGADESIRHRNRLLLTEAYLRLPPRRVLFFVKISRFEIMCHDAGIESESDFIYGKHQDPFYGPEDTIAEGK